MQSIAALEPQIDAATHQIGGELHAVDGDLRLRAEIDVKIFDLGTDVVGERVLNAGASGPAETGLRVGRGEARAGRIGRDATERRAAKRRAVEGALNVRPVQVGFAAPFCGTSTTFAATSAKLSGMGTRASAALISASALSAPCCGSAITATPFTGMQMVSQTA